MEFVGSKSTGIFAIHRDLDGEIHSGEFQEREQFIGLIIGQEEFLLPISTVREIIMLSPITYVPNSPEFIDGVINLRGNILPVINMRKVMRIGRGTGEGSVRVIIARYEGITFGLLVDGITYVVSLLPQEIENQSLPGKGTGAEFIGSISKHGNKVAGILDLVRIIKSVAGDALDEDAEEGGASEH
jgi:purine-binding chemotaxis protein CheW